MRTFPRRWAAGLVLALALSGCGDDDDGRAGSGTTVPRPSVASSTVAPPVTGPGAEFCALARGYSERLMKLIPVLGDPAALRELLRETGPIVAKSQEVAPPELKADVALLADSSRQLLVLLEQVDFDFSKVPPDQVARIQTPEVQAAGARLQTYTRDVCGVGR